MIYLIGITNYLVYEALGYEDDPIETGGRFDKLPMGRIEKQRASID